jgi:signal transduction histidine kinase
MPRFQNNIFAFIVFIAGTLISALVALVLYNVALSRMKIEQDFFDTLFVSKLSHRWESEKSNIQSLANFYRLTGYVTNSEFMALASHIGLRSHSVRSISWWQLSSLSKKDENSQKVLKLVYAYDKGNAFSQKSNNDILTILDDYKQAQQSNDQIDIPVVTVDEKTNQIIAYGISPVFVDDKFLGVLFVELDISKFVRDIYEQYRQYGVRYHLSIALHGAKTNGRYYNIISNKISINVSSDEKFSEIEWVSIWAVFIIGFLFTVILSIFIDLNTKKYKRIRESTRRKAESFDEEVKKRALIQKRLEVYQNFLEKLVNERTDELKQANEYLTANQNKLIESEKMASLGLMAAGIAHEINNPMGFIKSNNESLVEIFASIKELLIITNAYFMNKDGGDSQDKEKLVDLLESMEISELINDIEDTLSETFDGIDRIQEIVSNMRTFLHQGEGDKTIENIKDVVERSIKVASVSFKHQMIQIIRDYDYTGDVLCYPNRLSQVIINILNNSADSFIGMPNGKIIVKVYVKNEKLFIELIDDGKGMDEEILRNLFTPFYTTKQVGKGIGLGMYVSYTIMQRHGGDITVESEINKGTKFILELPLGLIGDE